MTLKKLSEVDINETRAKAIDNKDLEWIVMWCLWKKSDKE